MSKMNIMLAMLAMFASDQRNYNEHSEVYTLNIIYSQDIRELISVISQSGRLTTLFQKVSTTQINKIKISISDLFHNERNKLNLFLLQIKLYIRKYRSEFKKIENQILFAFTYFKNDAFK